jgi:exo-beta-1,3-glucanase (GH17 family)
VGSVGLGPNLNAGKNRFTNGPLIYIKLSFSTWCNDSNCLGMDCQAANYTLNAIRLLNVNMTALLTLWVDDNDATYERQYNTLFDIIEEYGSSPIEAVSVGNEVIYRNQSAASSVVEKIQQLRDEFARRQIRIPVTTTDLANLLDQNVISSEDIVMANIHPFFGGVNVSEASNWTMAFDKKELVKPALAENKTETVIAEVGWPTSGEANQDSVPSVDNLQFFVNDFVCDANKAGLKYYFFEAFDEPWKRKVNELEGSWGIMDENRNLKVTIPVC